jgi:hypothetical protein
MTFDKVRETDSFEESKMVENFPVVMLTYANDDYYMNAPQIIDEKDEAKMRTKTIQFENYKDL